MTHPGGGTFSGEGPAAFWSFCALPAPSERRWDKGALGALRMSGVKTGDKKRRRLIIDVR
ncbi:hypothetical protein LSP04_18960 [Levilactobacillus spicheri]|uniref:Uncharacterized protein n=1 Tax=Levilactobacillus spicheri TaxID=216463 RepID=A0ABQ0WQT2_9LACO|nr:hypothetical protein LSP04_18960 [Levilactobacillus spicheri]